MIRRIEGSYVYVQHTELKYSGQTGGASCKADFFPFVVRALFVPPASPGVVFRLREAVDILKFLTPVVVWSTTFRQTGLRVCDLETSSDGRGRVENGGPP